ncbi:MAG: 4Fe-4S binding protein [Bryobacteraceae bacterium]|nr:4Fe-4S binding protein [Bryobacteraceae bacterium]
MSCSTLAPPRPAAKPGTRKKLRQRSAPDRTQAVRRAVQVLFFALNVWIGVEFYLFVRYFENGGQGWKIERPPGVEGWLPIASLMNVKALLLTGELPPHHAAGMFLLLSFVFISLLFRKAFCSWLCPVGAFSELLWKVGRQTFRKNWRLPRWADIPLRSLKYILLGLFLYAVGSMSAAAIRAFLNGPYGVIADVKMLNFFRYLGATAAITIGVLVLLSFFVQNFWCRYLCPYGALLGLLSRWSPARVRRNPDPCIDCAKCTVACPSQLPVDELIAVRSPECTGCYECIAACPAAGALQMTAGRRRLPAWAMAAGIAVVFLGFVGYAMWNGHWHTYLADEVYLRLIPNAHEYAHP